MERDTRGAAISLLGVAVFAVGFWIIIDLLYYKNFPWLQTIGGIGLIAPNLVVGGYGLIEVGRYYGTAGETETEEVRYFSSTRISLYSGRDPTAVESAKSNATGLWYRVLWVGLAGQVVWAGLAPTDIIEGSEYVLRYTSLLATVLAAYYDMQYVGRRARWPGPQRWFLAFVVFPLNLVTAVAYRRFRRQRLAEAEPSDDDRDADVAQPTEGADRSWASSGWRYVIALATLGWLAIMLTKTVSVGTGPQYTVFVAVVWLALPAAIALDSRKFVDTAWDPNRRRWILGAFIPVCNLVVGPAYLLRRYETTHSHVIAPRSGISDL